MREGRASAKDHLNSVEYLMIPISSLEIRQLLTDSGSLRGNKQVRLGEALVTTSADSQKQSGFSSVYQTLGNSTIDLTRRLLGMLCNTVYFD
mgnify:CR=1 FL=1